MPSNYTALVMYVRFGLANAIVMTGFYIATSAVLLLPRTHPSRTYLRGRLSEGRRRINTALSREAAQCATKRNERAAA